MSTTSSEDKKSEDKKGGKPDPPPVFSSYMSPRSTTVVTRHSLSSGKPGVGYRSTPRSNLYDASSQQQTALSSAPFSSTKNERQKEKKEMQSLNERLGGYIEKVRFLEAQNRKLSGEIEGLKDRWQGDASGIKQMYETEIQTAKNIIDDTNAEKDKLKDRLQDLEDQLNNLKYDVEELEKERDGNKDTINRQNQQLAEIEPELNMLKRQIEQLEDEQAKDKKDIQRLQEELMKTKLDLDNETMAHLDAEARKQALEEELELLKQQQEQEIKELEALAYRDTTPEMREYWKSELSNSLRDLQKEYDDKLDTIRNELETSYSMKVNELSSGIQRQNMDTIISKEENKKLKTNLNDLKHKLDDLDNKNDLLDSQIQDLLNQLEEKDRDWDKERDDLEDEIEKVKEELDKVKTESQVLTDDKLSLELEIAAYKKLLETGETNLGLGVETSGAELRNILTGHSGASASEWEVKITTSDVANAGTDANVRMIIYGDKGLTPEIKLDKRNKDDFEKGTVSDFKTRTLPDVGIPYKIRIWHDNKGLGSGWHLSKVFAKNVKSEQEYTFNCDRWLDMKEDDKQVVRELPAEGGDVTSVAPVIIYDVQVTNGADSKMPSDATAFLTLFGEHGDSGPRQLKHTKSGDKPFGKGKTDTFAIEAVTLGRINKLKLSQNSKKNGEGWFVEKVVAQSSTDPSYMAEFNCNRWLAVDEGDKRPMANFMAAKSSAGK